MADIHKRQFYCYISNSYGEYYRASYNALGEPIITKNSQPKPLKYNPANIAGLKAEFSTNRNYQSLNRAITYPFVMIKDGADIVRNLDYTTNGFETVAFLTLTEWNPATDIYELYYIGRLDFSKKRDDPKTGFTINTIDGGAWGVLSQRDDIKVQINCGPTNPKAIKVLFDGITLLARYIFQPVSTLFTLNSFPGYYMYPLVQIAQDGDSSGVVTQNQDTTFTNHKMKDFTVEQPTVFLYKTQYPATVTISGKIINNIRVDHSGYFVEFFWYVWRSSDIVDYPADLPTNRLLHHFVISNSTLIQLQDSFDFSQTFDLIAGETLKVFFVLNLSIPGEDYRIEITPVLTNIVISTNTKVQPSTVWALRPLDAAQQIVQKATNGLFTIDSNYYITNNKVVITCGDALRQSPIAYIQSSFADWFKSYNSGDFIALRSINGNLWIEQFDTVYDQSNDIIDLGEVNDIIIEQDVERLINQVEVGSPTQDYRHSSGRLEFNGTNKFSLNVNTVKNVLNIVSVYRRDGFGAEFIRLDYQGGSTKDNSGDTSVFMVKITDELGDATTLVENFIIIEVDNAPLSPIITSPFDNDIITYPSPRVKGRSQPGQTIFIYVDTVLDGSTVAGVDGNWTYDIAAVLDPYEILGLTIIHTGVHVINATFSDLTGDFDTVTVTVTSDTTNVRIISPLDGDEIVDNHPLIYGVGQQGDTVDIIQDGVNIGTVTVDNSCKWEILSPGLSNGNHIIEAIGTTSHSISIIVNSYTQVPIITKIDGRPIDSLPIINNLPLLSGVALPGTTVAIYLDYYSNYSIGTAFTNIVGDWQFQVVPVLNADGIPLTPIPNGEHTLSTDLTIKNTPIKVVGYKLSRPDYDSIVGVTDNTVFNTELSPKRMLLAWKQYFASLMVQNQNTFLNFEAGDKNQGFSTTLDGVTIKENSKELIASLGPAIFLPITASFKSVVPTTFNKIFNLFNSGGTVHATYYGQDLWFLPIGRMSVEDITRDVQSWKLLLSSKTSLTTILNLYREGLTLNIMKNALYHSDYNTLHFTKYDFQLEEKYHAKELYDDWFENRNERWLSNPSYVQKLQHTDIIKDQIITNGLSGVELAVYRCSDAMQIDSITYNPIVPTPIQVPNIAMEVAIDMSDYDNDQYFFVINVGGEPVAISERVESRDDWPETILVEAHNVTNLTKFIYSSGIVSKLRIEGLVMKWQPDISFITNRDEIGDNQFLHGVRSKKRKILIGKGSGLPDYLYLKASKFVTLDTLLIEGIQYVADKENKLQEQDRVLGHPMYHYELDVELATNEEGVLIGVGPEADLVSVVVTTDAEAFGYGGGQLIDIIAEGE